MTNPNPLPSGDKRIVVIGTTGSGKTMLAQAIAQRFAIPHVELDALYWGPDWTPYPDDAFRADVEQATRGDNWVIDGNHSHIRDIVWPRANTLIWLDYALPVIFWNLSKRTARRLVTRQELWQGNRETWRNQFLWRIASRSLRRVAGREDPQGEQGLSIDDEFTDPDRSTGQTLNAHQRRRAIYPQLFDLPEAAHLNIITLRSPREANRWLETGGD
jgi:adenylate kinase family enzyme